MVFTLPCQWSWTKGTTRCLFWYILWGDVYKCALYNFPIFPFSSSLRSKLLKIHTIPNQGIRNVDRGLGLGHNSIVFYPCRWSYFDPWRGTRYAVYVLLIKFWNYETPYSKTLSEICFTQKFWFFCWDPKIKIQIIYRIHMQYLK